MKWVIFLYRTSSDRRFLKNKRDIQRAFIDLVVEKGYSKITISDIAKKADINRMTFYAHYDEVSDIFDEFVNDMEKEISHAISKEKEFNIDVFFNILNSLMYKEIDFFRFVAKEGNCAEFRVAFRKTIGKLIQPDYKNVDEKDKLILSDLASVCIAYSYLDWLSGDYGDVDLGYVISLTKTFLGEELIQIKKTTG